jgi:hypothetical protein
MAVEQCRRNVVAIGDDVNDDSALMTDTGAFALAFHGLAFADFSIQQYPT